MSESHETEQDPIIKVVDRRKFTADGQPRTSDAAEDSARPTDEAEPEPDTPPGDTTRGPDDAFEMQPLEEPEGVSFTMLINAMAQPALLFLGEIPHPETGEARVDPTQARLQIDMLTMLKVKCRGNLSAEEQSLLDRVLYQLRMLFVERVGP